MLFRRGRGVRVPKPRGLGSEQLPSAGHSRESCRQAPAAESRRNSVEVEDRRPSRLIPGGVPGRGWGCLGARGRGWGLTGRSAEGAESSAAGLDLALQTPEAEAAGNGGATSPKSFEIPALFEEGGAGGGKARLLLFLCFASAASAGGLFCLNE